jgi:hypothetical protein
MLGISRLLRYGRFAGPGATLGWAACVQGWLLRPACPRSVPISGSRTTRPDVVVGCSDGPTMNNVPLASKQCRFAQSRVESTG